MKKKLLVAILTFMFIGSLLIGCGNTSETISEETNADEEDNTEVVEADAVGSEELEYALVGDGLNEAKVLRIGYQPQFGSHLAALEEKFHYLEQEFEQDGITVEFYTFEKGTALLESMAAGGVDIGDALGDSPFITSAASGRPIAGIAAGKDDMTNTMWILADEGSGIESVQDLEGKVVAASIGSSGHLFLTKALAQAGLTLDDIELVNLADTDDLAALEGNSIDACTVANTIGATIEASGAAYAIEVPRVELARSIYVANSEYAAENPEIVARFLKILLEYDAYAEENRDEVQQLVADTFDIPYDNLEAYQTYNFTSEDLDDNFYERLEGSVEFLIDQEIITGLDAKSVTNSTYLEEARRLLAEDN